MICGIVRRPIIDDPEQAPVIDWWRAAWHLGDVQ
jgi:hypothetical protein